MGNAFLGPGGTHRQRARFLKTVIASKRVLLGGFKWLKVVLRYTEMMVVNGRGVRRVAPALGICLVRRIP